MTKEFLFEHLRQLKLAIVATSSLDHQPEAAVVGIAVTENLELIFDTETTTKKYKNMIQNPKVAVVIGWDNETTVQYEGEASVLQGDGAAALKEIYFAAYPDGRERAATWPNLVHFKITPRWIRYSNFIEPVRIEEMEF